MLAMAPSIDRAEEESSSGYWLMASASICRM